MFSYRHAFHAGNHADVLKHTTLIAIAQYLVQKDTPLSVIDTHAGAGLYRLDGDFAQTSGEAMEGIARMLSADPATLAPALQTYLAMVQSFNPGAHLRTYPGSPALLLQVLRPQDKLRLFELMPQDARALLGNAEQLLEGRQAQVLMEDGFANAKKFLPPPDRRGLLLCDPSYEMKTDYAKVATFIDDSLRRFATGRKRVVFIGMNPGPFGMVQCGVPFGEIDAVRDWMGIAAPVTKPVLENPKRPIEGFACTRSEVSGRRLWGLFQQRFGTAEAFFADHLVANYCPLAFFDHGRNVTPDKLPAAEAAPLYAACDTHLRTLVGHLQPEWVIGIGGFAETRAREALDGTRVRIGKVLHPSPASPAANRGWAEAATRQMVAQGIWA